jgi:nitrogen-specific signal transduction histidine kinase
MIFLLAIAALAAWTTVSYLYDNIPAEEYQRVLGMVSFKVWALTMGFMCIAGAFGLWAIQFSAETESILRMGQVVETMDYLNDGLMIADRRGRITGCNPSLQDMAGSSVGRNAFIREVFPCLLGADLELLLDIHGPNEVQRDVLGEQRRRALRFRSQTAGGAVLILVSDITTMRQHEQRKQQLARLELIGRIARGVADDFNEILSGIAGHAALLSRLAPGSEESEKSVATIVREAERGAHLAGHLLEFSHMSAMGKPTDNVREHIEKASDLIRVGLHADWTVETSVEDNLPVVSLSGLQIEQVVLNLVLAAADAMRGAGTIRITAGRPCQDHLMNVGDQFAVVVIMSVIEASFGAVQEEASGAEMDEAAALEAAGVIHSVVRSLLEESGGALELFAGPDGAQIYRVIIPYGSLEVRDDSGDELPDELRSYVAGWKVLLARESHAHDYVEEQLSEIGVKVERVDNVMSALARIESSSDWNAIVVEKGLLGDEANGLLKAIVKLCPGTGIVVLCEDPGIESQLLSKTVQFTSRRAAPVQIVKSMVEARGLAVRPHSV